MPITIVLGFRCSVKTGAKVDLNGSNKPRYSSVRSQLEKVSWNAFVDLVLQINNNRIYTYMV